MDDLRPAVAEYRAGLEAEIAMLHQLAALAEREREVTGGAALSVLDEISDARDRMMASLVAVESQLQPTRRRLLESIDVIKGPSAAALYVLGRKQQRIGHVVHQDRDPHGVDWGERNRRGAHAGLVCLRFVWGGGCCRVI